MRKSKIMTRLNERWRGSGPSIDPGRRQTKPRGATLLIEPPASPKSDQTATGDGDRICKTGDGGSLTGSAQGSLNGCPWRDPTAMTPSHVDGSRFSPADLGVTDHNQATILGDRSSHTEVSSIWHKSGNHPLDRKVSNFHQQPTSSVISKQQQQQQRMHHSLLSTSRDEHRHRGQFAMPTSCKANEAMDRERRRRKGEISSFIMILFGSIVISLVLFCAVCQSVGQSEFAPSTGVQQMNATSLVTLQASRLASTGQFNATLSGDARNLTTPSPTTDPGAWTTASSNVTSTEATTGPSLAGSSSTQPPSTMKASGSSELVTGATASTSRVVTLAEEALTNEGSLVESADEESGQPDEDVADDDAKASDNRGGVGGSRLARLINESADGLVDVLVEHLRDGRGSAEEASSESDSDNESDSQAMGARNELTPEARLASSPAPKLSSNSIRRSPAKPHDDSLGDKTFAKEEPIEEPTKKQVSSIGRTQEEANPEALVSILNATQAATSSQPPTTSTTKPSDEAARQMEMAMETYGRWTATSNDLIELFSRKMLPIIVEHGYDVDSGTVAGLLQVFNGIRAFKPWALKLLDASAKITPGLLVGTQSDFGDYDECLNVRVDDPSGFEAANSDFPVQLDPVTGLKSTTLVGKYCLADVEFPKPPRSRLANYSQELRSEWAPIELRRPLYNFSQSAAYRDTIFVETANFFHMLYVDPIRVGLCLTNKIDEANFAQVFNKLLEEFRITINFRGRCVTKYDRTEWSPQQRVSAYILVIASSLVVISSLLDVIHLKLTKLPGCPARFNQFQADLQLKLFKYRPLFTSFSIIRNTKRLFRAQTDRPPANQAGKQSALVAHMMQSHEERPRGLNGSQSGASCGSLTANTTLAGSTVATSSTSDSSVESSPCIERRCSSVDGSAVNLIAGLKSSSWSSSSSSSSSPPFAFANRHSFGGQKPLVSTEPSTNHRPLADGAAPSGHANGKPAPQAFGQDINLRGLHGIRVITMTWMIVNHTYLFGGFFVIWAHRRLIDIAEWPKSISFQLVLNGWLTVETYFFLSAMIVVLNLMPLMRRNKFNYASYILHRLLRLMPAYIGLVSLNFLWPLISSGPVWLVKGRSFIQTPCENYLWTNFLFINNWIWPEKQCMVHTWFLSADFQLYLIAPVIVYLLYRRPALGHFMNLFVALVASILSGVVIYANKLLPATLINKLEFDSIKQQLSYSYFATYQHMGPYCLGILIGYLLHKRPAIRLPKHLSWSLWLLLPPLSFTTLLLTYLWNGAYDDPDMVNPSPLVSALYVAIHRTIWTSLVAWIVFACATGQARLLSNFLSHSVFVPLSRLSFSIYLVHLPVIMFRALNLRHTVEWTDSNILWESCGNFIVSIIMGFYLNIAFESPIINLENFIFARSDDDDANGRLAKRCLLRSQATNFRPNMINTKAGANISQLDGQSGKLSSSSECNEPKLTKLTGGLLTSFTKNNEQLSSSQTDEDNKSAETTTSACFAREPADASNAASLDEPRDRLSISDAHNVGSNQMSILDHSMRHESAPTADWPLEQQQQRRQSSLRRSVRPATELALERQLGRSSLARGSARLTYDRDHDQADESLGGQHQEDQASSGPSSGPHRFMRSGTLSTTRDLLDAQRRRRHHQRALDLEQRSRYLLAKQQARVDDVYNIVGEYQHYAPGSYQRWRLNSASAAGPPSRASQFATLARTYRVAGYMQQDLPDSMYEHRRRDGQANVGQPSRPRSNFGGEPAEEGYVSPLDDVVSLDYHHHNQQQQQQLQLARHKLLTRRQARYNTLTGTGTRDWRLRGPGDSGAGAGLDESREQYRWPREVQVNGLTPATGVGSASSNWLQPGALIPRIDSSTLRRQARRPLDTAESSILEEPADGDDISSAL